MFKLFRHQNQIIKFKVQKDVSFGVSFRDGTLRWRPVLASTYNLTAKNAKKRNAFLCQVVESTGEVQKVRNFFHIANFSVSKTILDTLNTFQRN